MKKIIFMILCFFNFNLICKAIDTKLYKCVDGDTAWFYIDNNPTKFRFLAINTPESTNKIEQYGKEASEFTCNLLKSAKKISIEYDPNSKKLDKYNRHLVWVFIDNKLLQSEIIRNGYGKVDYIYGDYLYTKKLYNDQEYAKKHNLKIWKKNYCIIYYTVLTFVFLIILYIIKKKYN